MRVGKWLQLVPSSKKHLAFKLPRPPVAEGPWTVLYVEPCPKRNGAGVPRRLVGELGEMARECLRDAMLLLTLAPALPALGPLARTQPWEYVGLAKVPAALAIRMSNAISAAAAGRDLFLVSAGNYSEFLELAGESGEASVLGRTHDALLIETCGSQEKTTVPPLVWLLIMKWGFEPKGPGTDFGTHIALAEGPPILSALTVYVMQHAGFRCAPARKDNRSRPTLFFSPDSPLQPAADIAAMFNVTKGCYFDTLCKLSLPMSKADLRGVGCSTMWEAIADLQVAIHRPVQTLDHRSNTSRDLPTRGRTFSRAGAREAPRGGGSGFPHSAHVAPPLRRDVGLGDARPTTSADAPSRHWDIPRNPSPPPSEREGDGLGIPYSPGDSPFPGRTMRGGFVRAPNGEYVWAGDLLSSVPDSRPDTSGDLEFARMLAGEAPLREDRPRKEAPPQPDARASGDGGPPLRGRGDLEGAGPHRGAAVEGDSRLLPGGKTEDYWGRRRPPTDTGLASLSLPPLQQPALPLPLPTDEEIEEAIALLSTPAAVVPGGGLRAARGERCKLIAADLSDRMAALETLRRADVSSLVSAPESASGRKGQSPTVAAHSPAGSPREESGQDSPDDLLAVSKPPSSVTPLTTFPGRKISNPGGLLLGLVGLGGGTPALPQNAAPHHGGESVGEGGTDFGEGERPGDIGPPATRCRSAAGGGGSECRDSPGGRGHRRGRLDRAAQRSTVEEYLNKSDIDFLSIVAGRETALGVYCCARVGPSGLHDTGTARSLDFALVDVLNGDPTPSGNWSLPNGKIFWLELPTRMRLPCMPEPGDIVEHRTSRALHRVLKVTGTWIHVCDLEGKNLIKVNGKDSLLLSADSIRESLRLYHDAKSPPRSPISTLNSPAALGSLSPGERPRGPYVDSAERTSSSSPREDSSSYDGASSFGEWGSGEWDTHCAWRSGPPDPRGGWVTGRSVSGRRWSLGTDEGCSVGRDSPPGPPAPATAPPALGYLVDFDWMNKECIPYFSVELGRERALGVYCCARLGSSGLLDTGHDLEGALDIALRGETPAGRWVLPNGRSFTLEPPYRRSDVPSLRPGDIVEHNSSLSLRRILKTTGSWIHMCDLEGGDLIKVNGKDTLHLSGDSVRCSLGLTPLHPSFEGAPPPPQPSSGRGRGQ